MRYLGERQDRRDRLPAVGTKDRALCCYRGRRLAVARMSVLPTPAIYAICRDPNSTACGCVVPDRCSRCDRNADAVGRLLTQSLRYLTNRFSWRTGASWSSPLAFLTDTYVPCLFGNFGHMQVFTSGRLLLLSVVYNVYNVSRIICQPETKPSVATQVGRYVFRQKVRLK